MTKPWARYEVNFINHDKFRGISANAICLWVEGKNYADDKLTNGLLPIYEVKHWRFYSQKSVALLTASVGIKPGTSQPYSPLWIVVPGFGFEMHDYLDHNDCRELATGRIAKAAAGRQKDKDRKAAWRAAKDAKNAPSGDCPADVPAVVPLDKVPLVPLVPVLSSSIQNSELRTHKQKETLSLPEARESDLGDRARTLLENYAEWYRQERHGAKLRLLHNAITFGDAMTLCDLWDDETLEKLARIILTTDDDYITTTDRGFKIFVMKASWADDRLKAWEAAKKVQA